MAGAVRVAAGVNGMGCCFCTCSRPACGSPRCALPHFPVRWGASWSESSHPTCMRCLGWFKIGCLQGPLGCEVLLKLLFFECPVYVLLLLLLFLSLVPPRSPLAEPCTAAAATHLQAQALQVMPAESMATTSLVQSHTDARACLLACLLACSQRAAGLSSCFCLAHRGSHRHAAAHTGWCLQQAVLEWQPAQRHTDNAWHALWAGHLASRPPACLYVCHAACRCTPADTGGAAGLCPPPRCQHGRPGLRHRSALLLLVLLLVALVVLLLLLPLLLLLLSWTLLL